MEKTDLNQIGALLESEPFIKRLAYWIVSYQKNPKKFITQRQAFKEFGRSNVMRWLADGMLIRHLRPKRIEYEYEKLLKLQAQQYDNM